MGVKEVGGWGEGKARSEVGFFTRDQRSEKKTNWGKW